MVNMLSQIAYSVLFPFHPSLPSLPVPLIRLYSSLLLLPYTVTQTGRSRIVITDRAHLSRDEHSRSREELWAANHSTALQTLRVYYEQEGRVERSREKQVVTVSVRKSRRNRKSTVQHWVAAKIGKRGDARTSLAVEWSQGMEITDELGAIRL